MRIMEQTEQVNRHPAETKRSSSVLVVDDEPIGLEVVKALLGNTSYAIHTASSGQEALAKTESLRPDLILLDVLMPGMSGYDVCRRIRQKPHLADIPIILLTALNDRDAKLRGIQAGADDFISKPFDRLELSARVRTILRLNRYKRINTERAKFGWVVESADEGYIILDNGDSIKYANPEARRLLGIPEAEGAIQETFLALAKQQYQCQPEQAWADWPEPSSQPVRHLVRAQSDAAPSLWLQVDIMQADEDGDDTTLVRLRDVTHEINQQRLRWSFHSQIQHKFRHPLAILTGHLEILRGDSEASPEERTMLVENSFKASQHLSREILSVLDYVTLTAEGASQTEYCSVEQVIDVVERLDAQMASVTLDLRSDVRTPQTTKLPMSVRQVETVLWELFENSVKFHPRQLPALTVVIKSAENKIRLIVADDGVHLTPDQLRQVWTPYYQAERFYTGQVPGMGLGLSMIANTIWNLGGLCRAYNRRDKQGLVVELVIPIADNTTPPATDNLTTLHK